MNAVESRFLECTVEMKVGPRNWEFEILLEVQLLLSLTVKQIQGNNFCF